jgi:sialic acid synthase SpsE
MATQFIAEIGQNHNGDIELAKQLMQSAKDAGVDFVKFQKRDVEIAVPPDEWDILRETPWGTMPYIDYRKRLEFDTEQYDEIAAAAGKIGILWFASVWDVPSVDFMLDYDPPYMKVPSAKLTDDVLLHYLREIDIPIILRDWLLRTRDGTGSNHCCCCAGSNMDRETCHTRPFYVGIRSGSKCGARGVASSGTIHKDNGSRPGNRHQKNRSG